MKINTTQHLRNVILGRVSTCFSSVNQTTSDIITPVFELFDSWVQFVNKWKNIPSVFCNGSGNWPLLQSQTQTQWGRWMDVMTIRRVDSFSGFTCLVEALDNVMVQLKKTDRCRSSHTRLELSGNSTCNSLPVLDLPQSMDCQGILPCLHQAHMTILNRKEPCGLTGTTVQQ